MYVTDASNDRFVRKLGSEGKMFVGKVGWGLELERRVMSSRSIDLKDLTAFSANKGKSACDEEVRVRVLMSRQGTFDRKFHRIR